MMIMVRQRFARRKSNPGREVASVAQVTIAKGFDVDYYLDQVAVGADYYLDAGEPPGIWAGVAAAGLGLSGEVDAEVMRGLYHYNVGPDGVPLGAARKSAAAEAKRTWQQIEEAIQARIAELGPVFATPEKIREIRHSERSKASTRTPYYDMTFSAEKSVSLAWAAARVSAILARDEQRRQDGEQAGEQDGAEPGAGRVRAERYEALARSVEAAAMAGADAMLGYAERNGAGVRTGHHSSVSGQWRDAKGFIAAKFLQHTSRSNDPQLHVQIAVLNKAQREDGADEKWRALDGTQLWQLRLGASAHGGLAEAQALARMGLALVKRPDGNGYEIGGVSQQTMDAFSRRTKVIAAKVAQEVAAYTAQYGPPSRAALFKIRKTVTVDTRAPKGKPGSSAKRGPSKEEAAVAETRLMEWIGQAEAEHAQALEGLWDDIAGYAADHPEAKPSSLPSESERAEIVRAAVAEVQRQNAAWTRSQLLWELYRQMPVLPAGEDWEAYLEALADDALGNRVAEANVLQIGHVPDVVDVDPLGLRRDGTSVFRKPHENKYTTAEHLDREEWILRESKRPAPQLVTREAADAALAGTDLDYDQAIAARGLLTSAQLVTSLVAPAGAGKTHVMGPVSRAWMAETGGRVIGLTLSQNASHEMLKAGVDQAWNIARFFTRGVPVYSGDVLVVDEASQVSTVDLARIMQLAMDNGARVILTGDPEQLGPVEAGGMFGLVAEEAGYWKLNEIRRFNEAWEAEASKQLRAGRMEAWIEYGSRGLVKEGPQDRVYDLAADTWVLEHGQGRSTLLLTATNETAAKLSALVRQRRIERGEIPATGEIVLADGNEAGAGDLVRARLNSRIDAGGRTLDNRDTLRIEGWLGTGEDREAVVVRRLSDAEATEQRRQADLARMEQRREADLAGFEERREADLAAMEQRRSAGDGWSRRFTVPGTYLAEHAELDYAGNVHVAQGRTVDRQTLVVDGATDRRTLYVGMTRGRQENRAYVVTGPADPADWSREQREAWQEAAFMDAVKIHEAGDTKAAVKRLGQPMPEPEGMRERAPWESVIAAAMSREELPATAIETMRVAQKLPTSIRHLYDLVQAAWWKDVVPQIDEMVRERIPAHDYERYIEDPARPALLQTLRKHEIGGRSIPDLLDAITARPLHGLRSIAAGLNGRADKEPQPEMGRTQTWAERMPEAWRQGNSPFAGTAREMNQALDETQRELGEQLAENPPQWALEQWGVPAAEPGPVRDDWMKRATQVQAYRELAGITDPAQAIGPAPASQAWITEAFGSAVRALGLRDEAALLKAMGRGDLEAEIRGYERAQAAGPADVRAEMDANRADVAAAERRAEAARTASDPRLAEAAAAMQAEADAERDRLRVADAARREWEEATAGQASRAAEARAELRHRPVPQPGTEERQNVAEVQAGAEPEAGYVPERLTPERWAELKAAQTASVEADRQARAEASARAMPVTDEEIARYGQAAHETAADVDGISRALDQILAAVDEQAETRARAEAGKAEHELHEEASRQRDAEAAREAEVWERGTRPPARPPVQQDREMDLGPEL
jgi:hypothetical protein